MKKTLCLYYTRTNATRMAAELLAQHLGADLAEYTDGKDRRGIRGYLGACIDSFKKTLPNVYIMGPHRPYEYERVIVCMPVWAEGPAIVGKALLAKCREDFPEDVCFVVTHMAKTDYEKKINALDAYLKTPHRAHLSLRTKNNPQLKYEVRVFAEQIGK